MIESIRVTITTSLRQGRSREGGSGGSQRQNCEPTDRNVIEGQDSWVSWHNTTKPTGSRSMVNDTVVQLQFTVLSGEVCLIALWSTKGVRLRSTLKGVETPLNPKVLSGFYGSRTEVYLERGRATTESYGDSESTSDGNVSRRRQKSAEAIVATGVVKGRTMSNKEEL